jgi:hypothetical protein
VFVPLALLAAVFYAASTALQHRAASTTSSDVGPVGLFWVLLRDRRWLGGKLADLAATACQAAALRSGSLVEVQVLVACGVPMALGMGAVTERRGLRRDEQRGALAVLVGVAALVLVASGDGRANATAGGLVVTVAVVLVGTLVLLGASAPPWLLGLGAGAAFTAGSALLKAAVERLGQGPIWSTPVLLAALGFLVLAVAGNALVQGAFHRAPLRKSLPALTAAEPVTALLLGRMLFDGHVSEDFPGVAFLVLGLGSLLYGLITTSGAVDSA